MEQSVEKIIERNLLEVFNGRDADSRRAAIDELWNKDDILEFRARVLVIQAARAAAEERRRSWTRFCSSTQATARSTCPGQSPPGRTRPRVPVVGCR